MRIGSDMIKYGQDLAALLAVISAVAYLAARLSGVLSRPRSHGCRANCHGCSLVAAVRRGPLRASWSRRITRAVICVRTAEPEASGQKTNTRGGTGPPARGRVSPRRGCRSRRGRPTWGGYTISVRLTERYVSAAERVNSRFRAHGWWRWRGKLRSLLHRDPFRSRSSARPCRACRRP